MRSSDVSSSPTTAAETIYSSAHTPDPRSARDVLAFMLTPVEAFATPGNAEEFAAVTELLDAAKEQALFRWYGLHTTTTAN